MSGGCSIQNCGEQGLKFFDPPLCERHWEIVLLISRIERRGLVATAQNVQELKDRCLVKWNIQNHEIPGLLAEVQGVPA